MSIFAAQIPEIPSSCSCPRCGSAVAAGDINVATDAALCRQCGAALRYSELVQGVSVAGFDLAHPPHGTSFEARPDGFSASATTRTYESWFLVPFLCVWGGISMYGIYGAQIRRGSFDLHDSLFGIPFLLGTLVLAWKATMTTFGRVTITRRGDEGSVFVGAGPIGWTRRFRWTDLESVVETAGASRGRGQPPTRLIQLNLRTAGRPGLKFGGLLKEQRRCFLIPAISSQIRR